MSVVRDAQPKVGNGVWGSKQLTSVTFATYLAQTMGIFDYLRNNNRFLSVKKYLNSLSAERRLNGAVLDQLHTMDVAEEADLRVEFFFYTDELDKANNLAIELVKLNYSLDTIDRASGDKDMFIVTGWTYPMPMDVESLTEWTTRMSQLGYSCDCRFDGWGTTSNQELIDE